jgi:GT2 family glycosyltransferase
MKNNPLVTFNLVVKNGEKYIGHCLRAIEAQVYPNIEINVFDNDSDDTTRTIVRKEFPNANLIESSKNWGMWVGQEKAFEHSKGKYIIAISADIIIDPDFIQKAIEIMESDSHIGALQAKIFHYSLEDINQGKPLPRTTIDTCGFEMFRSRRVINIGHGEKDRGQYEIQQEIFGVEGAVPIFRREALEDIRVEGHFADPDYFWYIDDLDLVWRMHMYGWKQLYAPSVIAHHDRSTTKSLRKSKLDFIHIRRSIPFFKRALDYRNTIFTLIKNDYAINILKDILPILARQIGLWGYFLIFEPKMILEIPKIVKLLPNMVHRRDVVLKRARIDALTIHKWFRND